jgi:hypothetical protein
MARRKITERDLDKQHGVIDLTDMGSHNQMKVVRSRLDSKSDHLGAFADSPIDIISEDKGYLESKIQRQMPEDPEPEFEERLEMEGATILDSTTYFPASNTRLTKRSLTPTEIAEERGYNQDFHEAR